MSSLRTISHTCVAAVGFTLVQRPAVAADPVSDAAPGASASTASSAPSESWLSRLSQLRAEEILKPTWGSLIVKPQLDVIGQYTDNLNFQSKGLEQSDVMFITSPGLNVQYGRTDWNHITFGYKYDDVRYVDHSRFDTSQNHINFGLDYQLPKFHLTGEDRADFLSNFIGIGNTQRNFQIKRQTWSDNYTLAYDATDKLKPYLALFHYDSDYDKSLNFFGASSVRATLGTSYQYRERLSFFVEGHYGQTGVRPPSGSTGFFNTPHSEFFGGTVGARGDFTSKLVGTARLGFEERNFPSNPNAAQANSPTAGLDLVYTPTLNSQIKLTYERRTDVSATGGDQSQIYNNLALTGLQALSEDQRWVAQVNAGLDFADYSSTPGLVNIPYLVNTPSGAIVLPTLVNVETGRSDFAYRGGFAINYSARSWLRLTLAYNYERYQASFSDANYGYYNKSQLVPNGFKGYSANVISLQAHIGF
jgi:hypothetical protein